MVDEHPLAREGLRCILEDVPGLAVSGEAATKAEALKAVSENNFDIVLLGLLLPDSRGFECLKEIKALRPSLPVLVISALSEKDYGVRALRAGASGYVDKRRAAGEIVGAILTVIWGRKYIGPSLAERLAWSLEKSLTGNLHEMLSDREFEVMRLIVAGRRLKDIAYELSLSIKTISTYRSRILEKLDLESNAAPIRYAMENGLAD
ncbi:MAG: response regulator transcription factor [Nitrospirota bacterium]